MKEYSQKVIDRLDEAGLPRMVDALDILTICNEYVDKETNTIKRKATKGFAKLIKEYFQAVDQDLQKKDELEKRLRRTVKQVLK